MRALALGLWLGFLSAQGSSCTTQCGPSTCSGCCLQNECVAGTVASACGFGGTACAACASTQVCSLSTGTCVGELPPDAGKKDGGGAGPTPLGFCAEFAERACSKLVACNRFAPTLKSQCVSEKLSLCRTVEAAAEAGQRDFHSGSADACLARIPTLRCDVPKPLEQALASLEPCLAIFAPKGRIGDSCSSSNDCVGYSACVASSPTACDGRCATAGYAGQPCVPLASSTTGFAPPTSGFPYCLESGTFCEALTSTCRRLPEAGMPCGLPGDRCAPGTYCTSGVCVSAPPAGSKCRTTGSPACGPDAYCVQDGGNCVEAMSEGESCAPEPCKAGLNCIALDAGFFCRGPGQVDDICAFLSDCEPSLRCVNKRCAVAKGEGERCTKNSASECAAGLGCDDVLRTCVYSSATALLGASCTTQSQACREGSCLGSAVNPDGGVGTFGRCTGRDAGSACHTVGDTCPPGLTCVAPADGGFNGACAATPSRAPCPWGFECAAGESCVESLGVSPRCVPDLAAQELCSYSNLPPGCAEGLTCTTALDGGRTRCLAPGLAGEPCSPLTPMACRAPFECVGNVCVLAGRDSGRCRFDGGCDVGLRCVTDAGMMPLCDTALADGAPCSANKDCESLRCAAGTCQSNCVP